MTKSSAVSPPRAPEAPDDAPDADRRALTPHVPLRRVVMLANPQSGSVGPNALSEAETLLAEYGLDATVLALDGETFAEKIDAAFEARPDAILVLAGDGTAGTVAARAGPDGPLVAPLPGGTMNMLPKAVYGTADWKAALRLALEQGRERPVAGGEIIGDAAGPRPFFCAAILGAPALWAPAREAVRSGRLGEAWTLARRALKRAFTGKVGCAMDGRPAERAEAVVFISPLISTAMEASTGLEAAAMSTDSASDAFRLAAHAVFDDWRADPAVRTRPVQRAVLKARSRIPAVIDGEPLLLPRAAQVRFIPAAFRALAPEPAAPAA